MLINLKKNKYDKELWFALLLILCFGMTIITGIVVSKLIRPLFLDRYMYPAVGLLFLGIGMAVSKSSYKELLTNFLIGLIIINLPFSYHSTYIKEYKSGTENFKKFAQQNILSNTVITTDNAHLSDTILPYYLPNNIILKKIDKNTKGWVFTEKEETEMKTIIENANIVLLFNGDIDTFHKFKIYYVT